MQYLVHYRQRLTNVDWNGRTVNPSVGAEMTQSDISSAVYKTTSTNTLNTLNIQSLLVLGYPVLGVARLKHTSPQPSSVMAQGKDNCCFIH